MNEITERWVESWAPYLPKWSLAEPLFLSETLKQNNLPGIGNWKLL